MRAALIGAGFSKWAMGLPVASELFDFNIRPRGIREHRRLEIAREEWLAWKAQHPNAASEEFVAHSLSIGEQARKRCIWYITRRLSDPFVAPILGGTASYMIDDARVRQLPGVIRAQRFLTSYLGAMGTGIVTTNYDLLAEYALSTDYFNYGQEGEVLYGRGKNPWFPWQGSNVRVLGKLEVAKLHGSLSWDARRKYTDGRSGLRGTAMIVPPHHEKKPGETFSGVWALAAKILHRATDLAVFGFGFNSYDTAVLELLKESGKSLKRISIIDVAPNTRMAQAIWPTAKIETSSLPAAI